MSKKVLYIDDSATSQAQFLSLVKPMGFEVHVAEDGLMGLKMCAKIKPDLILVDVLMPNLSGYEVCATLKSHPDFKQIPIIILTGKMGHINNAMAQQCKANAVLSKPLSKQEYESVLERLG